MMTYFIKPFLTLLGIVIIFFSSGCSIHDHLTTTNIHTIELNGKIIIGEGIGDVGEEFADIDEGNDTLKGSPKNDLFFAGRGDDILYGEDGTDFIYGEKGEDIIFGNDINGNDDKHGDYLAGGRGYDVFISNNQDYINDSDGNGIIVFEKNLLTGGNKIYSRFAYQHNSYRGDDGIYTLSKNTLIFSKYTGETLTIKNFINGALGIILTDSNAIQEPLTSPIDSGPNTKLPEIFDDKNSSTHSTILLEFKNSLVKG